MPKRTLLFLLLIVPIYYVICVIILGTIAMLLPPDFITQLVIFLPLYLISTAWVTSYIIRNHVIPQHRQVAQLNKHCLFGAGLLNLCTVGLIVAFVATGFTTPLEAFVICAILVVIVLWLLITRRWLSPDQNM